MRTSLLKPNWIGLCSTLGRHYVACAVLMTSLIHGQEKQDMIQVPRKAEIPFPPPRDRVFNRTRFLSQWIREYQAVGDDFEKRNHLAFCFAHYNDAPCEKLSVMAFDPATSDEAQVAIIHLASAVYTKRTRPFDVCSILNWDTPWFVAGQLKVLRSARALRPDGSDRVWPKAGPLGPKELPKHIASVLDRHPILSIDVAQTLEVYGPLALKEAGRLLPLLLSDDADVVAAAQSAIRKMDPEGVAKTFQLEGEVPLTLAQRQSIRDYLDQPPVVDTRESDGTPQSEMSKQFEELRIYIRQRKKGSVDWKRDLIADRELALRFRDQKPKRDWWRVLCSAQYSTEFAGSQDLYLRSDFASALYTEPGAQTEVLKLLDDDDPRIVENAMELIISLSPFTSAAENVSKGDHVDPDVMPARFVRVLERFPHLYINVADCLGWYGAEASEQAEALVPHLLSDDPYVVTLTQATITKNNLDLAEKLDIVKEDFNFYSPFSGGLTTLTPGQQELVEAYLKSRK